MTDAELRIEATDLRRSFKTRKAVDGLSLRVTAGEIYGLVGPDGAGKTTTLRMLAGLLDPSGGHVRLVGRDPFGKDATVRDTLGYMPQQYSLYGDLTVAENLAFFREMFCLSREAFRTRQERLLAITRLAEFKDRRAEALSGGMYKKLALSCALLNEPKVLLLDEPTNGVDPVSRREFWDLLRDFLSDGMAILLATPYMDEASRCHRAGMLFEGRLLEEGRPDELLGAFPHPVFRVRGDRAKITAALDTQPDVLAFTPAGAELRVVVRRGREQPVLAALSDIGAQISPATASFEDLFLTRVRERTPTAGSPEGQREERVVSDEVSVRVTSLDKHFGAFVAVSDVSFEAKKGEIFGYLGANGAGKSTTIRMLCGLLSVTSGEVEVAGVDVVHRANDVRRAIGYMSQKFSLYLDLTVAENLEFFGGAYDLFGKAYRARAGAVLHDLALDTLSGELTGSLPGGMRQRVALACALLHQPRVVFLDEPTAGVDPDARRNFWRVIRGLADGGTTILVTTHYMDEAEYCDRVGLMVAGKLAALDTPESLKRTFVPGRMYEVQGGDAAVVQKAAGELALLGVEPFGTTLHVRVAEGGPDAETLKSELIRRGVPVTSVTDADVTLEDVFLRVVGGAAKPRKAPRKRGPS